MMVIEFGRFMIRHVSQTKTFVTIIVVKIVMSTFFFLSLDGLDYRCAP